MKKENQWNTNHGDCMGLYQVFSIYLEVSSLFFFFFVVVGVVGFVGGVGGFYIFCFMGGGGDRGLGEGVWGRIAKTKGHCERSYNQMDRTCAASTKSLLKYKHI